MQNIKFKITQTLNDEYYHLLKRNSEEINLLVFKLDFILTHTDQSLYYRIYIPLLYPTPSTQSYYNAHGVYVPRSSKIIYLAYSIFIVPHDLTNHAVLIITTK